MVSDPFATGERVLSGVLEKIRGTANVEIVFGEPRVIGEKSLIPVAAVSYGFGAGAGGGTSEPEEGKRAATGGGAGGGGGVRVKPLAVLEVTTETTRLIPVLDYTRLATMGMALFFILGVLHLLKRGGR